MRKFTRPLHYVTSFTFLLETETVTHLVIQRAHCRKGNPQQAPPGEGVVGQTGKGVKALGLTANGLGQYAACQVGIGYPWPLQPCE